eukprot:845076-Alexandrium_andersonii.AAC.1
MSASLVGSEMCIRDRHALRVRAALAAALGAVEARGQKGGVGLKAAGAPVSYTHLTLPTICSV